MLLNPHCCDCKAIHIVPYPLQATQIQQKNNTNRYIQDSVYSQNPSVHLALCITNARFDCADSSFRNSLHSWVRSPVLLLLGVVVEGELSHLCLLCAPCPCSFLGCRSCSGCGCGSGCSSSRGGCPCGARGAPARGGSRHHRRHRFSRAGRSRGACARLASGRRGSCVVKELEGMCVNCYVYDCFKCKSPAVIFNRD